MFRVEEIISARTSKWPPAYLLVLSEIIFSTLKMEAICSSETSVATQQTTRRHIPEDNILHNHRCENLKSCIISSCQGGDGFLLSQDQPMGTELQFLPNPGSPYIPVFRLTGHSTCHLLARWFAGLSFDPEDGGAMFL
jgi:hypothetical protein